MSWAALPGLAPNGNSQFRPAGTAYIDSTWALSRIPDELFLWYYPSQSVHLVRVASIPPIQAGDFSGVDLPPSPRRLFIFDSAS